MPKSSRRASGKLVIGGLAFGGLMALAVTPALADESGTSVYLLGSGGPGTAIMAPVRGVFFSNTGYLYAGKAEAGREFPIGGSVVVDLEAVMIADFPTVLWVPSTDFLGGTLGLGATLPLGHPDIEVSGIVTGPGGGAAGVRRADSAFVVGDPVLTGMLGWTHGNTHLQLSTMVNVPIGDYREDQLANLAFNRWAVDSSMALTWHDAGSGWDISGKVGATFNGENDHTDYDSGNEFHAEFAIEKTFSETFSAGVQIYHLRQFTDDTGAGATLGAFRGEVTGAGMTGAWNFPVGQRPATLRVHAFTEFDVRNRLKGDALMVDFSIPLAMSAP